MYTIIALNSELKRQEIFHCSNHLSSSCFKDQLSFIKHGHNRDWVRLKRHIKEEVLNNILNFRIEMKYIVTQNENEIKSIFIFDKNINHDYFYEVIKFLNEEYNKIISAGFTDGLSCYGRSETLDKDSNPLDFKLIE